MIKTMAASKAAKLLGMCVCPVGGAAVLSTQVPQIRKAVHKATAPRQVAKARARPAVARVQTVSIAPCPPAIPVILQSPAFAFVSPDVTAALPTFGQGPFFAFNPGLISVGSPGAFVGSSGAPGGSPGPGPIAGPGPGPGPGPSPEPLPVVPEPSTWAQLLMGLALIGGVMRSPSHKARVKEWNPEKA